jgi:hypothetical protein
MHLFNYSFDQYLDNTFKISNTNFWMPELQSIIFQQVPILVSDDIQNQSI